ncbi:hypothetical protein TIFTF001_029353 [Ficus carica]|uniref:Uncharacterized protein n=1 Tax=Ficus carica TaxID=3494 RepID=A0AA88IXX2_FICCA|nr:hypothetical protein TIFTF001_029353 [Ficus carica]
MEGTTLTSRASRVGWREYEDSEIQGNGQQRCGKESGGVFGAWKVGNGGEWWEVGVQKSCCASSKEQES